MESGAYLITLIDNPPPPVDNSGGVKPCQPRARCGFWRSCPVCSKIRQARAADQAERLLGKDGPVMLTVAQAQLGDHRNVESIRQIARRALGMDCGLWSVERGQQAGRLHVNIITRLTDYEPPESIRMHSSIVESGARVAAAYATKLEQAPSASDYAGRCFGYWRNPVAALAGAGPAPVLRAYAAEYTAEKIMLAAASDDCDTSRQAWLADQMRALRDALRQ